MPDGLLDQLSKAEVRNLVAYDPGSVINAISRMSRPHPRRPPNDRGTQTAIVRRRHWLPPGGGSLLREPDSNSFTGPATTSAVSLERLSVVRGEDGRIACVRYVLPRHKAANWVGSGRGRKSTRPSANGVVELSPCDFLDRLADLVPPPRKHRHRPPI
jgi:hypothetical protein